MSNNKSTWLIFKYGDVVYLIDERSRFVQVKFNWQTNLI